jgi:hypothetical protein
MTVQAIILVCTALALVLLLRGFLRRTVGEREGATVADTVMAPLAGLYGLLLAFLVGGVSDRSTDLRRSTREEAEAFARMEQIAGIVPPQTGVKLHRILQNYAHVEATARADQRLTPAAERALNDLWYALAAFDATTRREIFLQSEALSELETLREQRRVAASMARAAHGPLIWVVLLAGSLCITAECAVASLGDPRATFHLAALTLVITLTLYALHVLSRPLISPTFEQAEAAQPPPPKVQ